MAAQRTTSIPAWLAEFFLLRELPGYTRKDLMEEDAQWVERIATYVMAEAKEQNRLQKRAAAKSKR